MSTLEERIAKASEKYDQLMRQKKSKEVQDRKKKMAADKKRELIVGGIVVKWFPEILSLQPRLTNAENQTEFASLENILSLIAADTEYLNRLKEMTREQMSLDKQ
jgi:hypothetical protein